jgi:hypothetical protein
MSSTTAPSTDPTLGLTSLPPQGASTNGTTPSSNTGSPGNSTWLLDQDVIQIHNAFILGWKLTELTKRVAIAASLTDAMTSAQQESECYKCLDKERGNVNMSVSLWRALFTQIASIHNNEYLNSSTRHSFYEPSSGNWSTELYLSQGGTRRIGVREYVDSTVALL